MFSIFAAGAFFVGYREYVDYTLVNHPSGQGAQQLRRLEDPYNPFALILEGRSEWTVFLDAASERPFIGFGSWAKDKENKYAILRAERTEDYSNPVIGQELDDGIIPAHSVLGTAMIWAGVAGFFGAILLFGVLVRLLTALVSSKSYLAIAGFVFGILTVWDFFFSPIQILRLQFPHTLALLIVLTSRPVREVSRSSARTPPARMPVY